MHIGINIANHRDLLSKRYIHDTARMAEDLGFDSVWIPDHAVVPRAVEARYGPVYYDAISVLGYLAGITSRVRLGTTVLVIPYRHPIVLAKELASIDQLSEGRLILGVGVGWAEVEFQALGASFAERGRCTDEALRAMQTLWTQDAPQYSGPYCSFADIVFQPKPVQQPLPIWVGGQSRAALRRTAQFATGWHPIDQSPAQLQTAMATLATLSQQAGRQTPALCPRFTVRVRETASDAGRQFMEGSTTQITADLLQLQALGAAHVVLSTQTNDMARFRWEIETLAAHVIPRVR
jgi:probable F420-dependent oxidoreductase